MLALVQALEPFASNPQSLALARPAMTEVRRVAMPPWAELLQATSSTGRSSDEVVLQFMDGKQLVGLSSGSDVGADHEDQEERAQDDTRLPGGEADPSEASTAFCNAWLDAVGCAVTGRLLERIMRIPSLSSKGCDHLNADLNYLVNVLSALDVAGHPHPLLTHVAELTTMEGDTLSELIARRNRKNQLEAAMASIQERMAAIRGVAARYNY
jgi:hypothetical protein